MSITLIIVHSSPTSSKYKVERYLPYIKIGPRSLTLQQLSAGNSDKCLQANNLKTVQRPCRARKPINRFLRFL